MPTQRKDGPKTPEQIYDDLMKRERKSSEEREAVAEFQEEERALAMADDDQIVTTTATGKMIRRHGSKARGYNTNAFEPLRHEFSKGGLGGFIDKLVNTGIQMMADITGSTPAHQYSSCVDGIRGHFKHKGAQRHDGLQPKHEDEDFIYDAMFVSSPVHKKLMQEAEIIAAKVAAMESVKNDPVLYKTFGDVVEKLATEYEMRLHPLTGVYIHDFQRVMREEKQLNGKQSLKCEFKVCIFLAKAELSDLRGIKAKIGDPYNDDPQEAIAAGDHLKGHAPAVAPSAPAPHLT